MIGTNYLAILLTFRNRVYLALHGADDFKTMQTITDVSLTVEIIMS